MIEKILMNGLDAVNTVLAIALLLLIVAVVYVVFKFSPVFGVLLGAWIVLGLLS